MSAPRAWEASRYREGDEAEVLALFHQVFGHPRSPEHWRWQFTENPYGPPVVVLARDPGRERLVGTLSFMLVPINAAGERLLAGQAVDLAVHEDFRRQGIFETIARECATWCRERGCRALIAFPNPHEQSYHGFVGKLGWSRVLDPSVWELRLGLRPPAGAGAWGRALAWAPEQALRALAHLRLARTPPGLAVEWLSRVPSDHDALWSACAPEMALSLWKDRAYFAWRYDRNPDHTFEYLALRRGGTLVGLAVVLRGDRHATLCELLCSRADGPRLGSVLVGEASRRSLARRDARISFLGGDDGFYARCLRGFSSRPAPEVLTARGYDGDPLDARIRGRATWTMTFGDADYV